jgi:hypothetical protein
MPPKKKKPSQDVAAITFEAAFTAFNAISTSMEAFRHDGADGDSSARWVPVPLMKSAAMCKNAQGAPHELLVRGLTQSNVVAMKNTIGISGSLSSSNFLVREEFEEVPEKGTCLFVPELHETLVLL